MKTIFPFPGSLQGQSEESLGFLSRGKEEVSRGQALPTHFPGPCQNHVFHPLLSPSPPPTSSGPQKLLGKLCEQNKVVREQDRLVQQLRAEKVRAGGRPGVGGVWGAQHTQVWGAVSTLHSELTERCLKLLSLP